MKSPTDDEIEKAAIYAFQICRGESIHTWTMKDDDPEADYWRQIWSKGAKWARDQQPKPTCDRDCPEAEFGACSHPSSCVKQITYNAETFIIQPKIPIREFIQKSILPILKRVVDTGDIDELEKVMCTCQPKLKPLEWIQEETAIRARPFDFAGKYTGPYYSISKAVHEDLWYLWWSPDNQSSLPMKSEDECKAQAWEDYQERVKKMFV